MKNEIFSVIPKGTVAVDLARAGHSEYTTFFTEDFRGPFIMEHFQGSFVSLVTIFEMYEVDGFAIQRVDSLDLEDYLLHPIYGRLAQVHGSGRVVCKFCGTALSHGLTAGDHELGPEVLSDMWIHYLRCPSLQRD